MAPNKFGPEFDESLILQVRNYRALYDFESKDYKDIQIKDTIWAEIAKVLNKKSAEECKARWKNIRDTYLKLTKKKKGKTGDEAKIKNKWALYDHLTFLEKIRQERPSMCNILDSDNDENVAETVDDDDGENDAENLNPTSRVNSPESASQELNIGTAPYEALNQKSPTPQTSNREPFTGKRKLLESLSENSRKRLKLIEDLGKEQTKKEDDVDLFLRSVAFDIKKLPANQIRKVKVGILTLVNEAFENQECNNI